MKRLQVAIRLAAALASLCWAAACLPLPYTTDDDARDGAQLADSDDAAAEAPDVASGDLSDAKPSDAKSADAKHADIKDVAPDLPDVASAVDADAPTDDAAVDDAGDPTDAAPADDVFDPCSFPPAADAVVSLPEPYTGSTAPATILFIGNSYTYTNDLPGMFIQLLASTQPPLPWKQQNVTPGGKFLYDQATTTGAMAKIAAGGWTWVVLQGQSLEPACDSASFLGSAKVLAQQVKSAKANLAYYSTWARQAGSGDYATYPCTGGCPALMFEKLKAGYETAAQQTGGLRVPVGDAWMQVIQSNPEINLYNADQSHPSVAGTYLTACVFAKVLVGIDPRLATLVPEGISLEQALILRKVAAQIKP